MWYILGEWRYMGGRKSRYTLLVYQEYYFCLVKKYFWELNIKLLTEDWNKNNVRPKVGVGEAHLAKKDMLGNYFTLNFAFASKRNKA